MPRPASRAITSPAGTADTMETLARVDLDLEAMQRVVASAGGCLAWGGAVRLTPADDIFIGVERALDLATEGPFIASVLPKKIAAGAPHVVPAIPVAPHAHIPRADAPPRQLGHVSLGERSGTILGKLGGDVN